MAARHEALRTSFALVNDQPTLQIATTPTHELEIVSLTGGSDREIAAQLRSAADKFLCTKTDLVNDPLFSTKLLRLSDTDHVLLVGIDHIVTDGTSSGIVRAEIEALYRKSEQMQPQSLPEPAVQAGDYAVWQQQTFGSWRQKHEEFWRKRPDVSRVDFPFHDAASAATALRWEISEFSLGSVLTQRLGALALKQRLLMPLTALTVIAATLSRWCDRAQWAVDFVSHGRHGHPELAGTVGFISTILQLQFVADPDDSLLQLLKQIHEEYAAVLAHQDHGRLQELLPIFTAPVVFNWAPPILTRQSRRPTNDGGGVQISPFPLYETSGELANPLRTLNIRMFSDGTECIVRILHQADLLTPRAVRNLGESIRSTTMALLTDPDVRLRTLPPPDTSLNGAQHRAESRMRR